MQYDRGVGLGRNLVDFAIMFIRARFGKWSGFFEYQAFHQSKLAPKSQAGAFYKYFDVASRLHLKLRRPHSPIGRSNICMARFNVCKLESINPCSVPDLPMNLTLFKKYYKIFNDLTLPKDVWQTGEYEAHLAAIAQNKDCGDWYFKQKIKDASINYKKYCCLKMAYHLIEDKKAKLGKLINYDSIITHKRVDFGLPIHDGGIHTLRSTFVHGVGKNCL